MNMDEIKKIIIEQILEIAPEISEDDIDENKNIQRSLEIDSFDFLKILTALNEKLGIEVPEADYSKVDTLNNMAEYFLKQL
ncbi:acyl carrier protein [Sulfurimonas sp. CVO]|jgi:acyl carrier protein|uniref:acyl carrier protein n=1 Tax=Sulfurimonas sp. CVO TaxID=2283483 RepID=UPI000CADBEB2|nr:acyl carrier protein [Sulfurimonas sp. CVO]PLY11616.1 MAG: phosphopantetheine-binding protein [Sulfurimonas sp.]QHG91095.1 acyl carrier protein [Sulfurimonas sp. CVO]